MRPLKALSFVFGFAMVVGCQGPDEFYRLSNDGEKTGTAGSSSPGTAGSTAGTGDMGTAGTTGRGGTTAGSAGSIISGAGGSIGGTAGTTGAGGGGGSGTAGSTVGTAGSTGTAGSGTGRGGTTGGGAAGSASARGGTTGTAGASGTAGTTGSGGATPTGGAAGSSSARGGTTGTAGASGSAGTTGSGGATPTGGAAGRGPDRIQVVAKCQDPNGAQDIRVTLKILNPESVAKQWSDIKVRYYYTPTMPLPATARFDFLQKIPAAAVTTTVTNSYVEIGFTASAGMIAGFDNTIGSDEMQLHLSNYTTPTWNTSQADDYSFKACAGGASTTAYTDRLTMPGYYQGQLAWGSEPDAP
jgi:hypothetical protein